MCLVLVCDKVPQQGSTYVREAVAGWGMSTLGRLPDHALHRQVRVRSRQVGLRWVRIPDDFHVWDEQYGRYGVHWLHGHEQHELLVSGHVGHGHSTRVRHGYGGPNGLRQHAWRHELDEYDGTHEWHVQPASHEWSLRSDLPNEDHGLKPSPGHQPSAGENIQTKLHSRKTSVFVHFSYHNGDSAISE